MKTENKRSPGRPALDGAAGCTERINAVVTPLHKQMLDELTANRGISVWLRDTIETAYKKKARK
jgi:hypothetical protein